MNDEIPLLRYEYNPEIVQYLNDSGSLLRELCDRGLKGINKVLTSCFINEENNAILFLLRNAVAYIDAMSEVIKIPSVETLKLLARSFFEVKCFLEYIVKENTHKRAVAYQVYYIKRKIKVYKKFDPETVAGKEFSAKWEKDITFSKIDRIKFDTKKAINNLESQLARSPFKEINEKYNSLGKNYEWYSFDTGKRSLESLCEYLGYQIQYDYFYRFWSGTAHSTNVYQDNLVISGSMGGIEAIRSLNGLQELMRVIFAHIPMLFYKVFEIINPEYFHSFAIYYNNQFYRKKKRLERFYLRVNDHEKLPQEGSDS